MESHGGVGRVRKVMSGYVHQDSSPCTLLSTTFLEERSLFSWRGSWNQSVTLWSNLVHPPTPHPHPHVFVNTRRMRVFSLMCLSEQCAMWRRLPVEGSACGLRCLISPTPQGRIHITHYLLHTTHTHTCSPSINNSWIRFRITGLKRRKGIDSSLFLFVKYVLIRLAVNHNSKGTELELTDFGILLFGRFRKTTKQLGWWERRLPFDPTHDFKCLWCFFSQKGKYFFPFKTTFFIFSHYLTLHYT